MQRGFRVRYEVRNNGGIHQVGASKTRNAARSNPCRYCVFYNNYGNRFNRMDDLTEQLKSFGFTKREELAKFVEEYECYLCTDCLEAPITFRCGHNVCRECYHQDILDKFLDFKYKDDDGNTFFDLHRTLTTCGVCYKPHNLLSSTNIMSGLVKEVDGSGGKKYNFEAGWEESFKGMKAKVKEEFEKHVNVNCNLFELLQKTGLKELAKKCAEFQNTIDEQVSIFFDSILAAMLTLFLSHDRKMKSKSSLSSKTGQKSRINTFKPTKSFTAPIIWSQD